MNNPVDQPKVSELDSSALKAANKAYVEGLLVVPDPSRGKTDIRSALADAIRAYLAVLPQPQATTVGVKALELADFVVGTPVRAPGRNEKGIISDLTADGRAFVDYPAGGGKYWPLGQLQSWNGHRDDLGRQVRAAWIKWAMTQPAPKASWLVPYDQLSEPDKEADRQIGEAISLYSRSALIGIPGAAAEPVCGYCKGTGTEADYVGPEMKCIESTCSHCNGTGIDPDQPAPTSERVQALELALRPFAEMAVRGIGVLDDAWVIRVPTTEPQPTLAMFRHARAALLHEGQG